MIPVMTARFPQFAEFAGATDVGLFRSHNEDNFSIDRKLGLALVADGMGGHVGGDIASQTAVNAFTAFLQTCTAPEPSMAVEDALIRYQSMVRQAVAHTNHRIMTLNRDRGLPEGRGMGTTLVGLWFPGPQDLAVLFHIGDSRLYRLRDGQFSPLTRDHSLYQVWLDSGGVGEPPNRNVILRALGIWPDPEAEIQMVQTRPGDLYLLCTDGLNGMIDDDEMAAILTSKPPANDLDALCRQFIQRANERGGRDNITVVLAQLGQFDGP
jgi:serine/threonine protein phosphatase PrpC